MAEYIEREALMEQLGKKKAGIADKRYTEGFNDALMRFRSMVHSAKAADVVEVKHGRWEDADDMDGVVCSVCGEDFCVLTNENERFKFCPNCGAIMDGE